MNTKIKLIDVFGQFENQGTGHYYTYLPKQQEAPMGWKNVMKDPRNEVSSYLKYCYATWCTATDWWIAKMIRNPHDPKGGFAMLSICLGSNRPLEGENAIKVLDSFAQFFIIEQHWDDADAEKALINQEQDLALVPCVLHKFVEPTAAINSAFRSFETKEELGRYLSFLPQPGYEEFSRIFFVPKEESQGMPVKCIDETLPLKKIYTIHYPDDCYSPSKKTEILEGEDLDLVYTKPGLEPIEIIIKGGDATSDYADVKDDSMYIRSGKDIGLVHNRVITIKCQDKDGKVIDRFRLNNYTRQFSVVTINGDQVILPENFSERVVLDIIPADDKYETKQEPLELECIKDNIKIVVLEPKDYKVVFRMGTEDFETNRTMNPSTAKTRWSGFDIEVDNAKKTIYFRAYGKPTEKRHEMIQTTVENPSIFERFPWLKYAIIALAVLLLGYGIYAGISGLALHKTPWPFEGKTEVKGEVVNKTDNQEPIQQKQEEVKPIDTVEIMKMHDIDYLVREKKLWTRDSILSTEFQALYDNISRGEVENVISQYDELFSDPNKTNDTFKLIVEGLKKLVQGGDQIQKQASDEMKRLSKDKSIKLEELLTSINMLVKRNQTNMLQSQPSNSSVPSSSSNSQGGIKKPNSTEG